MTTNLPERCYAFWRWTYGGGEGTLFYVKRSEVVGIHNGGGRTV